MSDEELVKMARLAQRDDRMATGALYGNLADRIEALTAERDAWKGQHAAEALGLHVQMQRAEAAEAKLAKAVEGLRYYAVEAMPWEADDSLIARCALAEIEEEKCSGNK